MNWKWRDRLFRALSWLAGLLRGPTRSEAEPPPDSGNAGLEGTLEYKFRQPALLETALTHPSAAAIGEPHYERLEFLGDAVLDLAIADLLMRKFPEAKEGVLSKERASLVNGRTLARKASEIGLGRKLRLGKGEEKSGGRDKTSILAATFEAVIGAIYTDGGLDPAQRVVAMLFVGDIGRPHPRPDFQTQLPESGSTPLPTPPVY